MKLNGIVMPFVRAISCFDFFGLDKRERERYCVKQHNYCEYIT